MQRYIKPRKETDTTDSHKAVSWERQTVMRQGEACEMYIIRVKYRDMVAGLGKCRRGETVSLGKKQTH